MGGGTIAWLIASILLIEVLLFIEIVDGCNEAVCGSVVSKCLLTQKCKCDLKNCTCCKECAQCLSYLYSECCSCVDICPKSNSTHGILSTISHVEEFTENGVPALFNILADNPNPEDQWKSIRFPIDIDTSQYEPQKSIKVYMQTSEQEVDQTLKNKNTITLNCTVVFWTQCMSTSKCSKSCQSMGASSFRWFHNGCCECVGSDCINYGINESRCKSCPSPGESNDMPEELIDDDDDSLDYGQNDDDNDADAGD